MWDPDELFFVVVAMSPARASKDTDRMMRAMRTSMSEKPSDFLDRFKADPPQSAFVWEIAKPVPRPPASHRPRGRSQRVKQRVNDVVGLEIRQKKDRKKGRRGASERGL
jgi:hypothetical protein